MPEPTQYCHCGKPLHYNSPEVQAAMKRLIGDLGTHVMVTAGGRSWMVQRHYMALHGIKAGELPDLGFEEVTGCRSVVS